MQQQSQSVDASCATRPVIKTRLLKRKLSDGSTMHISREEPTHIRIARMVKCGDSEPPGAACVLPLAVLGGATTQANVRRVHEEIVQLRQKFAADRIPTHVRVLNKLVMMRVKERAHEYDPLWKLPFVYMPKTGVIIAEFFRESEQRKTNWIIKCLTCAFLIDFATADDRVRVANENNWHVFTVWDTLHSLALTPIETGNVATMERHANASKYEWFNDWMADMHEVFPAYKDLLDRIPPRVAPQRV